jgi:hypothetical protein
MCRAGLLKNKQALLVFGVATLALLILNGSSILGYSISSTIKISILWAAVMAISSYLYLTRNAINNINTGQRQPYFIIGLSIFLFGYMHTLNYANATSNLLFLSPFYFIDKYVGGAYFTLIRLRYGLAYSIFAHAFINSVPIFVILVSQLFLKSEVFMW